MKFNFDKKYASMALYFFLALAGAILFYVLLNNFSVVFSWIGVLGSLLSPFVYAFCMAYLLNPLMKVFERWYDKCDKKKKLQKPKRGICILLTYVSTIAVITLFIIVISPQIRDSLYNLYQSLQAWIPKAGLWVQEIINNTEISQTITTQINKFSESLGKLLLELSGSSLSSIWLGVKSVTTVVYNIVIGLIISVYMLSGKENFYSQTQKIMKAFMPRHSINRLNCICHDANQIFSSFIIGKIVDSIIVGVICTLAMQIMQLPFAALIGVIVGITNIIPYFGAWLGGIVGALILLVVNPMQSLIFIIFVIVLQQVDGNIISPKILSNSTGISSFWVMFAIIIGGGLFGIAGMFIGVPVFALIYSLFRAFINRKVSEKEEIQKTVKY